MSPLQSVKSFFPLPIIVFFLALFFFVFSAIAQQLEVPIDPHPNTPKTAQLTIDSGGHLSHVSGLAFTPDGKYLISTGWDKVIRVWDWQTGQTIRTIHGHIGPGKQGRIQSMALAPNGHLLAVGVITVNNQREDDFIGNIRLHNLHNGKVVVLRGHKRPILGLAFSADGTRLISGGGDKIAIIWDVAKGLPIHRLEGHKGPIDSVAFNRDGSMVVTASRDSTLRSWSTNDGNPIAVMEGHSEAVLSVAISPKDDTVASGSWDGTLRIWDIQSGKIKGNPIKKIDYYFELRFSKDGNLLITSDGNLWDTNAWKLIWVPLFPTETLGGRAVAISPDGRLLARVSPMQHSIDVLNLENGLIENTMRGSGASIWAAAFSSDGTNIAWGNQKKPATKRHPNSYGLPGFSLRLPAGERAIGQPQALSVSSHQFLGPITEYEDIRLKLDSTFSDPKTRLANMNLLNIYSGEQHVGQIDWSGGKFGYRHQAFTLSYGGDLVVTGGANGQLWAYDNHGNLLGEFVGHDGYVWAVAISPDNRFLLSGADDQTLKLWNLKTRELIITLFYGNDQEWVIWNPQGYYISSLHGDRMLGWQVNYGEDKTATYIRAVQLQRHLFSPEIINESIRIGSAKEAVIKMRGKDTELRELLKYSPPKIKIISPLPESIFSTGEINLIVEADSNTELLEGFNILVNHRQVIPLTNKGFQPESGQNYTNISRFTIPLLNGKNLIQVTARNWVGQSEPQEIIITNQLKGTQEKGTLYVVAVGVDEYPHVPPICEGPEKKCDLNYAGKDAISFNDTIIATLGSLHKETKSKVLYNGAGGDNEPTQANINNALGLIADSEINDTVVVFLSGHGVKEGEDYFFLPTNATPLGNNNLRWLPSSVLPWVQIEFGLDKAGGQRMLFVDTCRAAAAYNSRLIRNAEKSSIVAFSAADGEHPSIERDDLENGLFTHAILRGLKGEADLVPVPGDHLIHLWELAIFVENQVKNISLGNQQPEIYIQKGKNYLITRVP